MALTPNNAGAKNVGAGSGAQFITGGCVSDADCSSSCCAQIGTSGVGICSAEAASQQNGKTGQYLLLSPPPLNPADVHSLGEPAWLTLVVSHRMRLHRPQRHGDHCCCQGAGREAGFLRR